MIKELQSLGLNVRVLSEEAGEVPIRENEEESEYLLDVNIEGPEEEEEEETEPPEQEEEFEKVLLASEEKSEEVSLDAMDYNKDGNLAETEEENILGSEMDEERLKHDKTLRRLNMEGEENLL